MSGKHNYILLKENRIDSWLISQSDGNYQRWTTMVGDDFYIKTLFLDKCWESTTVFLLYKHKVYFISLTYHNNVTIISYHINIWHHS